MVVSDSLVAVSWINKKGFRSINHVQMIYDIRTLLTSFQNMSIVYCSRAQNSFTDALAKKASNMEGTCLNGAYSCCLWLFSLCSRCFSLFPLFLLFLALCCCGLSSVAAIRGCSLAAVHGALTEVLLSCGSGL